MSRSYTSITYMIKLHLLYCKKCVNQCLPYNYVYIIIYIYGLDRIKRAGAITLDIKRVCIYKYRAMYNNNIVLQ